MDTSATTREFTLEFLEQITDNFSEERVIGRGRYGVVYKGVLENGEEIALKKLHPMLGPDVTQFRNEFNNLMRAQHPNVARLVGYCYEIRPRHIIHKDELIFAKVEERVLCFEYLQGGSLEKHISDESCGLDWSTRFKIIKGVCEGLNYLHNGCKDPIYHLDLKPANVLLDKNMFPKIGDFGLSRLFPSSQTYITNKNIGTPGYMPPEYIERRKITSKSDVFSLGVIIVRIIAGDEGYSKCADMSLDNFLEHVHGNWGKRLKETMASHTSEQVKTCIEIALRCMKVDREKRPTIAEIVDELNLVHTAESSTTGQVMASNRVKLSRSRPTIAEIVDELNLVHTAESSTTGQVMASNRVTLLYKGHQILNVIFGILIGLIAVLRWCKGRAEFDRTAIQTFLVNFSMIVFICVLPQSLIRRYFLSKKGRGVCFEAYIWTGAMVLHDYVALLMINIQYIRIVMIPGMILILIGTLGWKLRKSRTVEVGSSEKNHDRVNTMKMEDTNNEEILFVEKTNSSDKLELFEFVSSEKNHDGVNTMKMEDTNNEEILNSSDKLELFEFVSYLLQLSLVTWTQYKGQQGCTPVLSDFLLFFCSALGALGVMLASPLAGVNFRAVSEQVLPVLHKTCAVALFIAVHTLAAEWLREDMAYVCLPELITVLAWFTICFGESMSVSNFKSHRSKLIMVSSVVAILAGLISLNANDSNMQINLIMWSFRISLSSSAFSLFHVWLLHGWPGRSSESIRLIHLLNVASIVGSSTAAILCAYMIVTDPMIMYEAISSFEHKAIAAVVPIILLTQIVLSAPCRPGQPETQTHKILVTLGWEHLFCGELLHKPRIRDLVEALKRLLKQSYRNSGLLKPRSTKDAAAKAAFDAAAVAVAQAEAKQRQRQQQHHGR